MFRIKDEAAILCAEAGQRYYEGILHEEKQTHALKRLCLLRDSFGEGSAEFLDAQAKYCAMYDE